MERVRTPEGHEFALKTLRDAPIDSSEESVKRFWREARATSTIQHPNVVRLFDVGSHGSTPYLVMELLDGKDLSAAIRQEGPLDPALVVRIFVQACRGLAALHAQKIIHRDIKPSNIFLHRDPSGLLVAKLCDLGIAKHEPASGGYSTELTHTGGIIGSPHYMSPEQVQDSKRVDHRTDIWSICISLYEALVGRKRWAACTNVGDLFVTIFTKDTPELADDAPWLTPGLCAAVHRGLRRERDERYRSVSELIAALEPFAAPESALTVGRIDALSDTPEMATARRVWPPSEALSSKVGRLELKKAPARALKRAAVVLGLAAVAAGAAVAWITGTFSPSPWEKPARIAKGRLAILPPSALVAVEGVPTPVQGGFVWITAQVGAAVRVTARHGAIQNEMIVRLGVDGSVSPSRFDIHAVAGCTSPGYSWDESKSPGGPNRCATDCQCDGARTCNKGGFCEGTAR